MATKILAVGAAMFSKTLLSASRFLETIGIRNAPGPLFIKPSFPDGPITEADFLGGTGDDQFAGTAGDDNFFLNSGGNDRANGKAGNDYFFMGETLNAGDRLNGGAHVGFSGDTVELLGDYSAGLTLAATTFTDIETLILDGSAAGGDSYDLTLDDANVSGLGMNILFSDGGVADFVRIDASAETTSDIFIDVSGANGDDSLVGGAVNDLILAGAAGNDVFDGGSGGNDRVSFSGSATGVTVSLLIQGVAQDVGGGRMITLVGIEDISGTSLDDTIIGDDGVNSINTSVGSDTVEAGGGDDFVTINGTTGASYDLDGGIGNDTLRVQAAAGVGLTFSLALQGTAQASGTITITAENFENVSGTFMGDVITGDEGANSLYGANADDVLTGRGGADTLYGDMFYTVATNFAGRSGFEILETNGGRDALNGGKGDDVIFGGRDKDKIAGGAGQDVINGGLQADTFYYGDPGQSGVGANRRDVIDFDQDQHDVIHLHRIDANTVDSGNQDFVLGGGTFTNTAGELIQFDGGGFTIVAGDVDGDGAADFEIGLTTLTTLVADDFVF